MLVEDIWLFLNEKRGWDGGRNIDDGGLAGAGAAGRGSKKRSLTSIIPNHTFASVDVRAKFVEMLQLKTHP